MRNHAPHASRFARRLPRPVAALCLLVLATTLYGCPGLNDPAAPNSTLTGTTPNNEGTFSGVITLNGQGGSVPADGATDVLISARIVDASGNPIPNGVAVNFATTLGSVRASGSDPAQAGSSTPVLTFEGRATVAVRSTAAGFAEVTAWIADVASTVGVQFEAIAQDGTIDVYFRADGGDSPQLEQNAPANPLVVAIAKDLDGTALGGVDARFKIRRDTTAESGKGEAYWGGPPRTQTNSAGEAFNTLFVKGVGEVVVFAEMRDPNNDRLIATSGSITLITTVIEAEVSATLTFDDGSTTSQGTVEEPTGIIVELEDGRTSSSLPGNPVRFRIVSDTSDTDLFDPAELASSGSSLTDTAGQASNAVIAYDSGAVIVLEVEVLDKATGDVIARSNQIVYTVQ